MTNTVNTTLYNLQPNQLLLASKSPRRKELLSQLGYQFTVTNSDIDESILSGESPSDYVLRLAVAKAQYAFNQLSQERQQVTLVLGSDTSVVVQGKILGKPTDETHCAKMLGLLSNTTHQVFTSIAVVRLQCLSQKDASNNNLRSQQVNSALVTTDVLFKLLTTNEIKQYWLTGEPQDKAGGYGIQGIAGQFIKSIKGSYSAVVGLPLYETATLLQQCGLSTSLLHSD